MNPMQQQFEQAIQDALTTYGAVLAPMMTPELVALRCLDLAEAKRALNKPMNPSDLLNEVLASIAREWQAAQDRVNTAAFLDVLRTYARPDVLVAEPAAETDLAPKGVLTLVPTP